MTQLMSASIMVKCPFQLLLLLNSGGGKSFPSTRRSGGKLWRLDSGDTGQVLDICRRPLLEGPSLHVDCCCDAILIMPREDSFSEEKVLTLDGIYMPKCSICYSVGTFFPRHFMDHY